MRNVKITKFETSMCFYEGFHARLRPTENRYTSLLERGRKKKHILALDSCQIMFQSRRWLYIAEK
uniref:Uncharacterized protein n=1 Tax=Romanomermis culicivorax TaxID=13658 RepID=A0A915KH03_ROMCU